MNTATTKNSQDDSLRNEIGLLGAILGDLIREFFGEEAFNTVEKLRRLARDRRAGDADCENRMKSLIAGLDNEEIRITLRSFTILLDLLNLVEDRRRIQVLSERSQAAYPEPRPESIRATIAKLKKSGLNQEDMQRLIDQLQIELVFTAHPTEAKRKTIRNKLRTIRNLLDDYYSDQLSEEQNETEHRIRCEIATLWQTDSIRQSRPTVQQEVERGLSIKNVLWDEVSRIDEEISESLQEYYGAEVEYRDPCLSFGSWIGGDRDGHPGVTSDITAETFAWLRKEAFAFHLNSCNRLIDTLSLSRRQIDLPVEIVNRMEQTIADCPAIAESIKSIPSDEIFRRYLSAIRWKLNRSLERAQHILQRFKGSDTSADAPSGYRRADELLADINQLAVAVQSIPGGHYNLQPIRDWICQIKTFGFHLGRLDIRQNADVYQSVVSELMTRTGIHASPDQLDEPAMCNLLVESLESKIDWDGLELSDAAKETTELFRVLHSVERECSMEVIGTHVISMTSSVSDVLRVLWLWRQTGDPENQNCLPIAPLLETIDDLENGPGILEGMLNLPVYRDYLKRLGDRQMIMLGYSDSTKDGGYLSACWSLYKSQEKLADLAEKFGVQLTFFHGRGGSLGRGGGPTARSILSLPSRAFNGTLRITEQGEVLSDRYDDPAIAKRHFEQLIGSSLFASSKSESGATDRWHATMERLSQESFTAYRELLESPRFVDYFRQATPVAEIEQLPIGSRPARRKSSNGLADLRAIPWVFSWTQSRCLIPAWFGVGTAFSRLIDDGMKDELREMYQSWPFFKAIMDNCELGLAKSDIQIASEYCTLLDDQDSLRQIADRITREYDASVQAVLTVTGEAELLNGIGWLKESIRVRNRYIDPLNLLQVELLKRMKDCDSNEIDVLRDLMRLSINGVASGMRTSG